ncbi:hypothetical protein [Schaalia hyovaginalis]|uniref:Uncharacterized protein n=1 Tax=Schaalia hyovaginalis TaxID=29316 RepID=A0A7K0KAT7_9ACTO|nr:hypothetical protein [Schaalia hyovaginalis]MBB6334447.1 hypothetical protein [Schaalia hyovaginalis]MCI7671216.1 hypothetical protein [Schaalia hyovaginalis]MDY2668708.1 hypothetical protein [Schaalia hyovaginalis]MDY5505400.1 hypothetical protein [Schaalia hyovaginalis]MDY6213010.1 hypothetical protein [Schaalia hyovaginalis]
MSSAAAATRPASRPERLRAEVSELRVVEGQRPGRSLLALALAAILVILTAVIASMVLHTRMAQTAFEIREQQLQLNALDAEAWSMQAVIEEAASPASLEAAARNAGMVPAGKSGLITLSTGTVEGGTPAN